MVLGWTLSAFAAGRIFAAPWEDYSTWSYSAKIHFNTTATGASVLGLSMERFPILIRLASPSKVLVQSLAAGADLRFADPDGTPLNFQIERWDAAAGKAEVWVNVPKIDANSNKDFIIMYWGKLTARPTSNSTAVFSAADKYQGVWHFDEASGGAVDATANGFKGTPVGVIAGNAGVIGSAYTFNGASSHVAIPLAVTNGLQKFTICMWVREKSQASAAEIHRNPTLIGIHRAGITGTEFGLVSKNGKVNLWHGYHTYHLASQASDVSLTDGKWHFLVLTTNGVVMDVFDAGVSIISLPAEMVGISAMPFGIGALHAWDGSYANGFSGDIDAVQIMTEHKGPEWIRLAYESQRPDGNFLTFGAPAELPPPAPTANPAGGTFNGLVNVTLTCATDNATLFYTLDGSEPTSAGRSHPNGVVIALDTSTVVKARAFRNGIAGPVMTESYVVRSSPRIGGDTLKAGQSFRIDARRFILYPSQEAKASVLLSPEGAWNRTPAGFDRLGPFFTLSPIDTLATFPGLQVAGDSLSGLALYRIESDGAVHWMPFKDGLLWIPSAGSYFWGRDIQMPRIRFAGTDAQGVDSLRVFFAVEDNISNLRCNLHVWNGKADSLGWRPGTSGEILEYTISLPWGANTPLEVRATATDETLVSNFPSGAGQTFTLEWRLSSVSIPLNLKSGHQWKMMGIPVAVEVPLTVAGLAKASGIQELFGAVWNPAGEGRYVLLKDQDTLPRGEGFWLASGEESRVLSFPASKSIASDSDGMFSVGLSQGWNLVTCPSVRPLAWPASPKDGDAYLRSPLKGLRGFDGTDFTRSDSLRPWEGYYVWYEGGDTLIRVGPGAARAGSAAFAAAGPVAKSSNADAVPARGMNLVFTSGGGLPLEMGAAGFAKPGLGVEDERSPPPRGRSGETWIDRGGRALVTDYVPWDPAKAMSWTVVANGKPQGYRMEVASVSLPSGFQAWAVSPSRRVKYRLGAGGSIPVTGDDTLAVYAGTPETLASLPDLLVGREAGGGFSSILRAVPGGMELILTLPAAARVDVRIWTPDGREIGGLRGLELGEGRHAWGWPSLAIGGGRLTRGVYLISIEARGMDGFLRRVEKFSVLR